ncbi:MAG: hypothetical protein MZV49_01790 [Rhodopseudomonas palustris]|nr:hypothetical protein [Rhodopseudomonas palustris]
MTALPPSSTPVGVPPGAHRRQGRLRSDAARAIQDKYRLTPLSQWQNPAASPRRPATAAPGPGRRSAQRVEDDQPLDARSRGRPARRRSAPVLRSQTGVGPRDSTSTSWTPARSGVSPAPPSTDGRSSTAPSPAATGRPTSMAGTTCRPKRDG